MGSFGSRGGVARRRLDVAPPADDGAEGPPIVDLRRPRTDKKGSDRESRLSHS
jgi:hypothetical protein